ncbi:MAG: hypothetical protein HC884_09705 [Chloroflexaceae bacterium]|nr:hypothetical protein [Chloroflexaceae bacterium]
MPHGIHAPDCPGRQASSLPDMGGFPFSVELRDRLLRSLRVRYLVVRPATPFSRPEQLDRQVAAAQEALGPLTRVYADETLHAYRLDSVAAWLDGPGQTQREEFPLFPGLDERWPTPETDGPGLTRWLPPGGAGVWVFTQRPGGLSWNFRSTAGRSLARWRYGSTASTSKPCPSLWVPGCGAMSRLPCPCRRVRA